MIKVFIKMVKQFNYEENSFNNAVNTLMSKNPTLDLAYLMTKIFPFITKPEIIIGNVISIKDGIVEADITNEEYWKEIVKLDKHEVKAAVISTDHYDGEKWLIDEITNVLVIIPLEREIKK